jgi:hypothetical protein
MKRQGNITLPEAHNSKTEPEGIEKAKVTNKEFKSLLSKMISDFKEDLKN